MYLYIHISISIYLYIERECDVMKTIQCAHPPHHHNAFVATCCRLWTASGGVHALLYIYNIYMYIYIYI